MACRLTKAEANTVFWLVVVGLCISPINAVVQSLEATTIITAFNGFRVTLENGVVVGWDKKAS